MTEDNEEAEEVLDTTTPLSKITPKKRHNLLRVGKLQTLRDIAIECSKLYRRAAKGMISSADASRQASILAVMKTCVESSDTERRVQEIEAKLANPVRRVA